MVAMWKRGALAAMFLGGCGWTESSPGRLDATVSDGCRSTDCEPSLTSSPEGGNIIFEYRHVDSELQATLGLSAPTSLRVMAYFMDDQTPDNNPFPMPGLCNNLEVTKGWPAHVGSPHVDLDVGTLSLTGKNTAGDDVTITPPRLTSSTDDLGRPHDVFYQARTPDAAALLSPDSAYTVAMAGAGAIAPTTLPDQIFLPHDFQPLAPALEDDGPLVAGANYVVSWMPAESTSLPSGDDVLGLVWLLDSAGHPSHLCITLHSSGTFTIPGPTIAEYRTNAIARGLSPDTVILSSQAVVHRLTPLPNGEPDNLRRLDLLGIISWNQRMDVVSGP